MNGSRAGARVLAVVSGKGGVGKTNLCLNLAVALSRRGRRVLLLDADMGLANVDVVCGIENSWNLSHVLSGAKRLGDVVVPGPAGVRLVPGASGVADLGDSSPGSRPVFLEQLGELEPEVDDVLIDTRSGVGPAVRRLMQAADRVIVVTTSEPPAITDTYALIKVLQIEKPLATSIAASFPGAGGSNSPWNASGGNGLPEIQLVGNQVSGAAEARDILGRLRAACRRFLGVSVEAADYVVTDPKVSQAVRRRRPFLLEYPACPASRCVRRLAGRLVDPTRLRPIPIRSRQTRGRGFLRRFAATLGGVAAG